MLKKLISFLTKCLKNFDFKDTIDALEEKNDSEKMSPDEVEFSLLKWDFGGFDGSRANLVDGCCIGPLSVRENGLSYVWQEGGCEMLGAKSREDACCIAALFCFLDGKWVGGKFDWISTSRTTRDFKNLNDYNGWTMDTFNRAEKYAFVIVSKNGSMRSNVITQ